ncbi:uncharacterized protein NECHADRAFT_89503 [Fusarium vanettenii 77-13-4]|uniref:Uncharacterized protein n=1 Tax=Fusarium vanettenii (strain ATCC MYA-4622 / CBS 123669 / FGSC 9596 / NRRL 45880 / 77-13-4) TaxID=660122 RepID=C7ZRC4_FUSV7|nr:uncharacterized protein NECHADRAFT_89503 [Fusarium vanettenii 77-13-4]EEU33431.1 predicted protein [Fusarium vanettenii 77-13-4]
MKAFMRASIGNDDIADYLTPEFGLRCRRLSPSNEYMEGFTKGNAQLVKSSVTRFTKTVSYSVWMNQWSKDGSFVIKRLGNGKIVKSIKGRTGKSGNQIAQPASFSESWFQV